MIDIKRTITLYILGETRSVDVRSIFSLTYIDRMRLVLSQMGSANSSRWYLSSVTTNKRLTKIDKAISTSPTIVYRKQKILTSSSSSLLFVDFKRFDGLDSSETSCSITVHRSPKIIRCRSSDESWNWSKWKNIDLRLSAPLTHLRLFFAFTRSALKSLSSTGISVPVIRSCKPKLNSLRTNFFCTERFPSVQEKRSIDRTWEMCGWIRTVITDIFNFSGTEIQYVTIVNDMIEIEGIQFQLISGIGTNWYWSRGFKWPTMFNEVGVHTRKVMRDILADQFDCWTTSDTNIPSRVNNMFFQLSTKHFPHRHHLLGRRFTLSRIDWTSLGLEVTTWPIWVAADLLTAKESPVLSKVRRRSSL